MQTSFISLLMLLVSGGGDELLNYIPTETYWKAKDVVVDVQTITRELDSINADDASKANAVRKLMAIRTLGELKDQSAVASLQKHLESKEMFVADYAKRAIANIDGKPIPASDGAEAKQKREADVSMLPVHCGAVGQITLRGGETVDVKKALAAFPQGEDKEEALQKVVQQVIDLAEQIGNVRLDTVTLGVAEEVGPQHGYFVLYARGQYDREAIKALIPAQLTSQMLNDVEFKTFGGMGGVGLPSDELFAVVTGAGQNAAEVPLEEVSLALRDGKGKFNENEELAKLLAGVNKSADVWSVIRVTDSYRQAPVLAAFDSMQIVGTHDGKQLNLEAKAIGQDAEAVKSATEQFTTMVEEAKKELASEPSGEASGEAAHAETDPDKATAATDADAKDSNAADPAAPAEPGAETPAHAAMKPIMDLLNSVQTKVDGTTATMTGTFKGSSPMMIFFPMMMQ